MENPIGETKERTPQETKKEEHQEPQEEIQEEKKPQEESTPLVPNAEEVESGDNKESPQQFDKLTDPQSEQPGQPEQEEQKESLTFDMSKGYRGGASL